MENSTIKYSLRLSIIAILLIILCCLIKPHSNHTIPPDAYECIDRLATYNPVLEQDIGYTSLYENCQDSTYACWPGAKNQIIDWGVSDGGIVDRFVFRYATNLVNPGKIVVRFYTGTNNNKPYEKSIAEFTLSNLKGSPDHKTYSFDYDFKIPHDKVFLLPKENFGYSFQVEKNNTGIKFARGGNGNENMLWSGNKHFGKYFASHYWSGLYLKLYCKTNNNRIRITPDRWFLKKTDIFKNNYLRKKDLFCQGKGVSIAIIDSGVDYSHPQLGNSIFPNKKVIGGYDFIDGDGDPFSTSEHGTLASLIAAGDKITIKKQYYKGLANLSKLYILKIKSEKKSNSTYDHLSSAIDWCVSHQYDDLNNPILIINISYGGSRCFTEFGSPIPSLTNAINRATNSGITILASSGNDGWKDSIRSPACINNVISVGAQKGFLGKVLKTHNLPNIFSITPHEKYSSNYGANDIWPSSNIYSKLDCLGPSALHYVSKENNLLYKKMGGTSMACAYMTGIVACLQSASKKFSNRYLSPTEIKQVLLQIDEKLINNYSNDLDMSVYEIIYMLFHKPKIFRVHNDGEEPLFINSIKPNNYDKIVIYPAKQFYIKSKDFQDVYVYLKDEPNWNSLKLSIEYGINKNKKEVDIFLIK